VRLRFHFNYIPIDGTNTPIMPADQSLPALYSRGRSATLRTI
jgi:hypothetical protein